MFASRSVYVASSKQLDVIFITFPIDGCGKKSLFSVSNNASLKGERAERFLAIMAPVHCVF